MKTVGVIVATLLESKHYFSQLQMDKEVNRNRLFFTGMFNGKKVVLIHSHAGPVNAASATESLIYHYSPKIIISSGTAGSHIISILPGDVVIGKRYTSNYNILDEIKGIIKKKNLGLIRFYSHENEIRINHICAEEKLISIAENISSKAKSKITPVISNTHQYKEIQYRSPRIHFGSIGSEDAWTIDKETIESKRHKFNHDVEDKESTYIAQICLLHKIPFVSVRGISDNELIFPTKESHDIQKLIRKSADNASKVALEIINSI